VKWCIVCVCVCVCEYVCMGCVVYVVYVLRMCGILMYVCGMRVVYLWRMCAVYVHVMRTWSVHDVSVCYVLYVLYVSVCVCVSACMCCVCPVYVYMLHVCGEHVDIARVCVLCACTCYT